MFRFKQFSVEDQNCGMKIGVDSVILGAYVQSELDLNSLAITDSSQQINSLVNSILDIGTGCGVLSLMMAQKFPNAEIDAVELDFDAVVQANDNFKKSPFQNKFTTHHGDVSDYKTNKKYDIIIANPPYFSEDSRSNALKREMARKMSFLPIRTLIESASKFLKDNASFYFIYPEKNLEEICNLLKLNNLKLLNKLLIKGIPSSTSHRIIFHVKRNIKVNKVSSSELTIELSRGKYTQEYIALTKDFYLHF